MVFKKQNFYLTLQDHDLITLELKVKLVDYISTHVNYAWEAFGLTPPPFFFFIDQ